MQMNRISPPKGKRMKVKKSYPSKKSSLKQKNKILKAKVLGILFLFLVLVAVGLFKLQQVEPKRNWHFSSKIHF